MRIKKYFLKPLSKKEVGIYRFFAVLIFLYLFILVFSHFFSSDRCYHGLLEKIPYYLKACELETGVYKFYRLLLASSCLVTLVAFKRRIGPFFFIWLLSIGSLISIDLFIGLIHFLFNTTRWVGYEWFGLLPLVASINFTILLIRSYNSKGKDHD